MEGKGEGLGRREEFRMGPYLVTTTLTSGYGLSQAKMDKHVQGTQVLHVKS